MRNKGLFVVVDGPSSSGKDSIIKQVLKDLKNLNIKAVSIEETKEKNYNRKRILSSKKQRDKKLAESILKERKKIYLERVLPFLAKGVIVIANRGEPTTLAYQTLRDEISMEAIWKMHRVKNIPLPDLVIIANCSVEEAIRRESQRELSDEEKDKKFMSGKFTDNNYAKRKQIHASYEKVKNFLEDKGLIVIYLNIDTMEVAGESEIIVECIEKKLNL